MKIQKILKATETKVSNENPTCRVPNRKEFSLHYMTPYKEGHVNSMSTTNQYEESLLSRPQNYQEQLRRQTIINSLENKDYLLIIASQQNKPVQQVKYELKLKLVNEG